MEMAPEQHTSSACDAVTIKHEPEMGLDQHKSSACDVITIKQEPVDAETHSSLKREIKYASFKEETAEWEQPDGHSDTQDPLSIVKEEWEQPDGHGATQDPLSIVKEECKQPDGHSDTQDPLSIVKEECPPSEDFFGPITSSIDKTENEEDEEEAVSKDSGQEVKLEAESTSSGSEPERRN